MRPASSRLAPFLLVLACGDAGSDTAGTGTGTGTTAPDPTTTEIAPTSGVAEVTGSGGLTGTTGDRVTTTSGATDTNVGVTDASTSTGPDDTTGTSTGTTADTTTDTTADATTDTTDTTTGDPPLSCLDVDFPVGALLCGDGGPACTLIRDELVSAKTAYRNDMPAIALRGDCGPVVLFSEAVGGYFGFHGERVGPDAWIVEPTPMAVATGSLEAVPGADELLAAVDDGAFGVSVWRRSGGVWQQESALPGMNHTRAPQLVRDSEDRLHLGHIDDDSTMIHDVFDGAWTTEPLLPQADIHVRIALGPADAPRLIAWATAESTWKLHYVAPPAPPEVVTVLGSNVLERAHTGLVLAGADMDPWVLLARKQAGQQHHDLVLAHRTGPVTWDLEVVFSEDPIGDEECDVPPLQSGQQCMVDYRRVFPAALVAGATEVRAFYVVINHKGTLVAECQPFPRPFCFWAPQTDESTGELRVAWPGAAPADHQVVAADVFTDRATARLDPSGAVHLAFYDYPPTGGDPKVRYLRVGG